MLLAIYGELTNNISTLINKGNNMVWMAAAMAAMSIANSMSSNSANSKAFVNNAEQVKKDYEYQIAQIKQSMSDANENTALEMAANRWNSLKTSASTTNMIAEKEIAGNTAARIYNQSKLNAMFAHNALAKKAEDTMASFGYKMDNVKQEANNAIYSAGAMAKKNTISTLGMTTSAAQAGVSGYTLGKGLSSFLNSDTIPTETEQSLISSGQASPTLIGRL